MEELGQRLKELKPSASHLPIECFIGRTDRRLTRMGDAGNITSAAVEAVRAKSRSERWKAERAMDRDAPAG